MQDLVWGQWKQGLVWGQRKQDLVWVHESRTWCEVSGSRVGVRSFKAGWGQWMQDLESGQWKQDLVWWQWKQDLEWGQWKQDLMRTDFVVMTMKAGPWCVKRESRVCSLCSRRYLRALHSVSPMSPKVTIKTVTMMVFCCLFKVNCWEWLCLYPFPQRRVEFQAPQHFRSAKMKAARDGCFFSPFICWLIPFNPVMSRTENSPDLFSFVICDVCLATYLLSRTR